MNNEIRSNLFVASKGAFCAYGGSSGDDGTKPYGHLASNIDFINNIFQLGPNGKCALYGPITAFDPTRPGNSWVNNRWTDGRMIAV